MLSSDIIKIIQKPRCGVPDVAEYSLFPDRPKWTSKVVTYRLVLLCHLNENSKALPKKSNIVFLFATRVISYTRDLSHFKVNQLVDKAFAMWSKEIPLQLKRIRVGIADIMIGFARGGKKGSCSKSALVMAEDGKLWAMSQIQPTTYFCK